MTELPTGTVTLLFTDIIGSTPLLEKLRDDYFVVAGEHERLVREALGGAGGHEVDLSGDTFMYVFRRAKDALAGAIAVQRSHQRHAWTEGAEIQVGIGIHTGEPTLAGHRYVGVDVHRGARIASEAGPGQILLSDATRQLVQDDLPHGVTLREVGERALRGLQRPDRLFQAVLEDVPSADRTAASPRGLPAGTVTFLFTDIEGSTELTRRLGDRWPAVHAEHRRRLREAATDAGGREVDTQGDSFFFVFGRARHALAAAAAGQRALRDPWPEGDDVPVRMGVHTGEPAIGEEGYLGLDVVRGSRIAALARGGEVLVSETTRALVRGDDLGGLELRDLGERRLKGIEEPERVFQLVMPGLEPPPAAQPAEDEPAFPVAGRESELASRAVSLVRNLGDLDQIGPAIERQVDEALGAARVPKATRAAPRRLRWPLLLGVLLLGLVVLVLLLLLL